MDALETFAFAQGFRALYLDTFDDLADAVRFYDGAGTSAPRAITTTRRRRSSCEKPSSGRRRPKRGEGEPLQNRVMPTGEIVAVPGRGLVMGNRGVLHDDRRRIVRATQVKRWIACRLAFRGRHRR